VSWKKVARVTHQKHDPRLPALLLEPLDDMQARPSVSPK
jgi:hypothetical protein